MSSQAKTHRRCLRKYSYISRLSGGCGRYKTGCCSALEGSVTDTVPPRSPGWQWSPRRPYDEPAGPCRHVIAARMAHGCGNFPVGRGCVPEAEDHEREIMSA